MIRILIVLTIAWVVSNGRAADDELLPEMVHNGSFTLGWWGSERPAYWVVNSDPQGELNITNGVAVITRRSRSYSLSTRGLVRDPYVAYRLTCRMKTTGAAPARMSAFWGTKPNERKTLDVQTSNMWREARLDFSIPDAAQHLWVAFEPPAGTGSVLELTAVSLKPMRVEAQETNRFVTVADGSNAVPAQTILLARDCLAAEKTAAWALRWQLYDLSRTVLPLVYLPERKQDRQKSGGIYIGKAGLDAGLVTGKEMAEIGPSGYRVRVQDGRMAIVGQNGAGTIAGVYGLLEQLGVKHYQYLHRPDLVVKPAQGPIAIGALDLKRTPAFEFCFAYSSTRACMGLTTVESILGTPMDINGCDSWVHSANFLVNYEKYHKAHPEYFARDKTGKPKIVEYKQAFSKGLVHLCQSNPEVRRIATETVLRWIEQQPDRAYYMVTPGDGLGWCECEDCLKMDPAPGKYTDRNLAFVNAIARQVAKRYPDKMIVTLAYGTPTEELPVRVKPEPNVGVMYCLWCSGFACVNHGFCSRNTKGLRDLAGWLRLMPGRVFIFNYPWNFYADAERLRFYAAMGIRGVHCCGFRGEFTDLTAYLYSRMMWDIDADLEELIDEFMGVYYGGKAAPFMRRYFNAMHEALFKTYAHREEKTGAVPLVVPPFPERDPTVVTDAFADAAYGWFDQALAAAAGNPNIIKRIQQERYSVLAVDLNQRNPTQCILSEPGRQAFVARLADFLRLAQERRASTVFYNTPVKTWLLRVARMALTNENTAWISDDAVRTFLAAPQSLWSSIVTQEPIAHGWRIPMAGILGSVEVSDYQKRMTVILRPESFGNRNHVWAHLVADRPPSGEYILEIEGMDNDKPMKALIELKINGKRIYAGEAPFKKDAWSKHQFPVPAGVIIAGTNRLDIYNRTPDEAWLAWQGAMAAKEGAEEVALEAQQRRIRKYNWGWFMVSEIKVTGLP